MPFIRSGVVTEFRMSTYTRGGGTHDAYVDADSSKVATLPSTFIPASNSRGVILSVTIDSPLPPHFTPGQWSWEIDYTWSLVWGFQGWSHMDEITLWKPEYPGNVDVAGSVSGSRRMVESGLPYQRGYERLESFVSRGRADGYRSATISVDSVSLTYDEYVPDTRGGNWRNLADFMAGPYPGAVDGGDFIFTERDTYFEMPPSYTDAIGLAEYSEDGIVWKSGVVYRITVLDYGLIDPSHSWWYADDGQPAVVFSDMIHQIGVGNWWADTARLPVGPAADRYGGVGYVCVPEGSDYLRFFLEGLGMARVRVEVYSTLPPPTIDPFWTDFQRTYEILSGE